MWDQKTGRSRGFGFVSFRSQQVISCSSLYQVLLCSINFVLKFLLILQDAQSAINDVTGKSNMNHTYIFSLCACRVFAVCFVPRAGRARSSMYAFILCFPSVN